MRLRKKEVIRRAAGIIRQKEGVADKVAKEKKQGPALKAAAAAKQQQIDVLKKQIEAEELAHRSLSSLSLLSCDDSGEQALSQISCLPPYSALAASLLSLHFLEPCSILSPTPPSSLHPNSNRREKLRVVMAALHQHRDKNIYKRIPRVPTSCVCPCHRMH